MCAILWLCALWSSAASRNVQKDLLSKHVSCVWNTFMLCGACPLPAGILHLLDEHFGSQVIWREFSLFQGAGTGFWFPLPCGTLLSSWPFLLAWLSRVTDAINFSHLFLQYKEGMWNPCGGCYWLDAYSMVVCDFRKQDLTFTIPWHSLSLHTPQTIWCIE